MRFILLLTGFILCGCAAVAQLKLQLGNHYLPGVHITKLRVSPDDHTIWALTSNHEIYYKKSSATSFQLYAPVAEQQVNDMAGYSCDEMYFAAEPNILIQVINGRKQNLTIPEPLVTRINGLAIMDSAYLATTYYNNMRGGWLYIGTNDALYALPKNSRTFIRIDSPAMHYNWSYLRSSFKGTTLRYNRPFDNCGSTGTHTTNNMFGQTIYTDSYDDLPPYPAKINTGLMSLNPADVSSGGKASANRIMHFWGTDEGLFGKYMLGCSTTIKKFINNQVNGIDEVYALSQLHPQHYILAATATGLQYTPSTVFNDERKPLTLDAVRFEPFAGLSSVQVTDVLVDSRKERYSNDFVFVCDQEAWVSTTDGIYQLTLSFDQAEFNSLTIPHSVINAETPVVYLNDGDAVLNICDSAKSYAVALPDFKSNDLVIKWYKNSIAIQQWAGKTTVTLKDTGSYRGEITSLCEGITIRSVNFIVQPAPETQISFNYPDTLTTCEGQAVNLTTIDDPSYAYKWYKNGQLIPGASTNSYAAALPGSYHVEVSNCGSCYKSSKTVTINIPVLDVPVITANKTLYCPNDTATLAVQTGFTGEVKWYLNGAELTANHNQFEIKTNQPGTYTAGFLQNGCQKNATPYDLNFSGPTAFEILKSKDGALCYGEELTLTAGANAAAYLWSTGETSNAITVSKAGHYTVQLTWASGCVSSECTDVNVLPQAILQPINDTVICTMTAQKVRINAQTGFSTYSWNGAPPGPSYLDVTQPGRYTLHVTTTYGCLASTIFEVKPWCAEVIIPNTFTPNGDGINDYWKIGGLERAPTALVQIFNRSGAKIMEYRGGGFAWDGRYRGADLPAGTYYYVIQSDGNVAPLRGYVMLIR